jgi:hypothetical protein
MAIVEASLLSSALAESPRGALDALSTPATTHQRCLANAGSQTHGVLIVARYADDDRPPSPLTATLDAKCHSLALAAFEVTDRQQLALAALNAAATHAVLRLDAKQRGPAARTCAGDVIDAVVVGADVARPAAG